MMPLKKEAQQLGREAVKYAFAGENRKMVTLTRISSYPYRTKIQIMDLEQVAGVERVMDLSYLEENHHQIRESYMDYILPLIGALPEYVELKGFRH